MASAATMDHRGKEAHPHKKILNLYTAATCAFCQQAKALLEQYKIAYVEHAVDGDVGQRDWVVEHSGGRKVLPQLFLNELHLGGFFELKRYCQDGTLPLMLSRG